MEKEVANYSTYKAAEEKLNAALEEIDSIKNDIKDFKYTGYGDKSAVSALRGKVTALQTKYGDDILSDADLKNLTDAEAAVKATGDKVDAVVVEIDKLPTSLNPLATVDSAVQAAKKSVEALVKEGVAPDTDISNYSDLVTLSEKVDAAKGEVDTLKADIAGFTYTGYGDKAEVEKLNDRLNALKAAYGDGILTDAELKNLTDAENAVEQTNNEIDAAVALINAKTATPLNPLSEAESALKDLHTAVDALADKGVDIENEISNYKKFADFEKTVNDASDAVKAAADEVAAFKYTGYGDKEDKATFTDAELKNLTAAEKALADLEQRSKNAHKAVAALPGADTVKLTEKADIEALNKEIAALETKGDSFTAAEKQKLADAQKGITDLEKAQADMKATLESLKDDKDVRYDDKAAEEKLSADIEALQDRGVAVDETTMGVNGWKRYTRYAAAVKAMNSELTGLNSKMQTELDSWTYPYDIAKYDALRKDMDAAAKKYGMTEEQTKAEFTNYETDKIQAAAAEEKIKQANAKIKALPATITKAQEQDVVAITAIVNELKAAPYKMTDSALQTALGSNYAIYTKAVATLAELNKPADNNSSGSSNNNNSNSSNTTSTSNKTTTTSTANKTTKPAAAATTIPQTSDAFPLTTLITLAVASLGGLIAVLFKKKRND